MKWAMIADDLTGANDSGVQLARDGLKTIVYLDIEAIADKADDVDALVIDTDSRLLPGSEAYDRVSRAAEQMKKLQAKIVYKKMDSTLRGNIGAELDAMFDTYEPEFVVIAPSFPANGRTMRDGLYAVHGKPLHESDAARDPATPVNESHIPTLLQGQTKKKVHLFRISDLQDENKFAEMISQCREEKRTYLLFDAETNDDLRQCVERMRKMSSRLVWAGSAGLAQVLSASYADDSFTGHSLQSDSAHSSSQALQHRTSPVMTVCGSVHQRTQQQLQYMLKFEDTAGVEVRGEVLIAEDAQGAEHEAERAAAELAEKIQAGQHVVLHTCAEAASIEETAKVAAQYGVTNIGSTISSILGNIIKKCMARLDVPPCGLILTGGDTARKVCHQLGITSFELIEEIEPGIPIGSFHGSFTIKGVTKSGGFGGEQALRTALEIVKGDLT